MGKVQKRTRPDVESAKRSTREKFSTSNNNNSLATTIVAETHLMKVDAFRSPPGISCKGTREASVFGKSTI